MNSQIGIDDALLLLRTQGPCRNSSCTSPILMSHLLSATNQLNTGCSPLLCPRAWPGHLLRAAGLSTFSSAHKDVTVSGTSAITRVMRFRPDSRANSIGSIGPSFSQSPDNGKSLGSQTNDPQPKQAILICSPTPFEGSTLSKSRNHRHIRYHNPIINIPNQTDQTSIGVVLLREQQKARRPRPPKADYLLAPRDEGLSPFVRGWTLLSSPKW